MKGKTLSPEEAVRLFDRDPSQVFISLTDFLRGLSHDEVLGELRSGRLRAGTDRATLRRLKRDTVSASEFVVSASDTTLWMCNPETPPDLVAKFKAGIGKPQ